MDDLPVPQRTRLSDRLIMYLVRALISGRLGPGEALPSESELALRFGISKSVVRESLQRLVSLRMIHVRQGKRAVVTDESQWNILPAAVQEAYHLEGYSRELTRQLYEVRITLESYAAELAAQRRTMDQLLELEKLVVQMKMISTGTKDLREFLGIDRAFHDGISRAAQNRVLTAVLRDLPLMNTMWSTSKVMEEELELLTAQHDEVVKAIRAQDIQGAGVAMRTHLSWAQGIETERVAPNDLSQFGADP